MGEYVDALEEVYDAVMDAERSVRRALRFIEDLSFEEIEAQLEQVGRQLRRIRIAVSDEIEDLGGEY